VKKKFWSKPNPKKRSKKLTKKQIAAAKKKFDKYPSAVANAWAAKHG
jgi:hypothetical protein